MPYNITDYTFNQAKKLGVEIKPSTNKKKKIDVFKKGEKVASIGGATKNGFYKDYTTYLETDGKAVADKRRKLYKTRHEKDRKIVGSAGYYADRLLW